VGPEVADETVHVGLLRLPRAQAVDRVCRYPDYLGVLQTFEVGVLIAQLTELFRTRAGECERIEDEHDALFPAEVTKGDELAGVVTPFELGRFVSNVHEGSRFSFDGHVGLSIEVGRYYELRRWRDPSLLEVSRSVAREMVGGPGGHRHDRDLRIHRRAA